MKINQSAFPKSMTTKLFSVAFALIFFNYSYEDSSRFSRDSLLNKDGGLSILAINLGMIIIILTD
tara:strand:+ start:321 stop:515 length:195 start_codon:yes stop_codon:yes gene_type:complete